MIRRIVIVVLTLAAVGMTVGSIVGDPKRFYRWDVSHQRGVGGQLSIRSLTLIYFKVGDASMPDIRRSWGGFGFTRVHFYTQPQNVYSNTWHAVYCPSWLPVVVFGAYPAVAFILRGPLRRRRRRKRGLCVKCGYNLTGLPEPRCPECWTDVEPR